MRFKTSNLQREQVSTCVSKCNSLYIDDHRCEESWVKELRHGVCDQECAVIHEVMHYEFIAIDGFPLTNDNPWCLVLLAFQLAIHNFI